MRLVGWILAAGAMVVLGGGVVSSALPANIANLALLSRARLIEGPIALLPCGTEPAQEAPELLAPSTGWLHYHGNSARLVGDCERARAFWAAAAESAGKPDLLASFNLGMIAVEQGDFESAAGWFRGAEAERAIWYLTQAATSQGDQAMREVWLDVAWRISLAPNTVAELSALLVSQNRSDEAVQLWESWHDHLPPDAADRWRADGEIAALRREWPAAAEAFALRLAAGNADYALLLRASSVYELAGRIDDAIAAGEQAATLAPERPGAYWRILGLLLAEDPADLGRARSWAEQAPATEWRRPYYLGLVQCRQGDAAGGRSYLEEAAALARRDKNAETAIKNALEACQ